MRKSINIALMLASSFAAFVAGPARAQSAAPTAHQQPTAAPTADAQPAADSDSDEGLSRDSEDCNKGCIDKN